MGVIDDVCAGNDEFAIVVNIFVVVAGGKLVGGTQSKDWEVAASAGAVEESVAIYA